MTMVDEKNNLERLGVSWHSYRLQRQLRQEETIDWLVQGFLYKRECKEDSVSEIEWTESGEQWS